MTRSTFILASASPRRLQLLQQAGLSPDKVIPAEIDETPKKAEAPLAYVKRMAAEKLAAAGTPDAVVLAADTVVAMGRRILPKAEDEHTARKCLGQLSGRRHRVYTAVAVSYKGKTQQAVVMTQVKFAKLSASDINAYIASGEWRGKAGGYAIQGVAEAFIPWISGSHSGVVGLPLAETLRMLRQTGAL